MAGKEFFQENSDRLVISALVLNHGR